MAKLTRNQILLIIGMCILISFIIVMLFAFVHNQQVYLGEINDSEYICIEDYDNINYTIINISREEFEELPCYRQYDWLSGVCSRCHNHNPPFCTAYYLNFCYNQESPENKYFDSIYLEKEKENG